MARKTETTQEMEDTGATRPAITIEAALAALENPQPDDPSSVTELKFAGDTPAGRVTGKAKGGIARRILTSHASPTRTAAALKAAEERGENVGDGKLTLSVPTQNSTATDQGYITQGFGQKLLARIARG